MGQNQSSPGGDKKDGEVRRGQSGGAPPPAGASRLVVAQQRAGVLPAPPLAPRRFALAAIAPPIAPSRLPPPLPATGEEEEV